MNCPAVLLLHLRQAHAQFIGQPTCPEAELWLSYRQAIAVDPVECFWGILGISSLEQIDHFESIFDDSGVNILWPSIINPRL